MAKRFLFNVSGVNTILQTSLYNIIGSSAYYGNFQEIIRHLAEEILYPISDYDRNPVLELFSQQGVDEEDAEDIIPNITIMLARMLSVVAHSIVTEDVYYEVSIDQHCNMLVEVFPIQETPTNNYLDEIRKDYEEGHWIPPRMREMAGI